MAALLIDNGCDVNATNNKSLSALDYCDQFKFKDLAYFLVLHGAENADENALSSFPSVEGQFMSTVDLKSFR